MISLDYPLFETVILKGLAVVASGGINFCNIIFSRENYVGDSHDAKSSVPASYRTLTLALIDP